MKAKSILEAKGNAVVTTGPETNVAAAVKEMVQAKIGALVVSGGSEEIVGIFPIRFTPTPTRARMGANRI